MENFIPDQVKGFQICVFSGFVITVGSYCRENRSPGVRLDLFVWTHTKELSGGSRKRGTHTD